MADAAVREAVAGWYDPATLSLLEGTPVNCLLLTFAGGADREIEAKQQRLAGDYAAKARERGLAVLGLVYPGAVAQALAAAAGQAKLDGLVLEGEFPAGFGAQIRSAGFSGPVIPIAASAGALRKSSDAIVAVEGVAPGVGKAESGTTASATAGLWVDSNMWLVRSFRLNAAPRTVWLGHRPPPGALPGVHLKSVADGAAAGGQWIAALEGGLRAGLLRKDAAALRDWRKITGLMKFFAAHNEWRGWTPFATVGIILDTGGPHLDNTEEFLNLVARRQIPYRVIDRAQLTAQSLEGLRAVLAFDLAPPSDQESKLMLAFASKGGLVMGGPAWGGAPKEHTYTVVSVQDGELAVFKDEAPDPQSVARDLNDLLTSDDFGVNVFNAPSVLTYVTSGPSGGMLIQMVNFADVPADSISIWVNGKFQAAKLYTGEGEPASVPVKRSGGRTEIAVPTLPAYGALLLE